MTLLTTSAEHSPALAQGLTRPGVLLVVCLCAAWCDVCREFRPAFERLADEHPDACLLWLDVEDDSELVGDVDVENFPTLAIYRDGMPLLFGTVLPQAGSISRVLTSLRDPDARPVTVPDVVADLPGQLAAHASGAA